MVAVDAEGARPDHTGTDATAHAAPGSPTLPHPQAMITVVDGTPMGALASQTVTGHTFVVARAEGTGGRGRGVVSNATDSAELNPASGLPSVVDVLLEWDADLDELARATFCDAGQDVPVTALDQFLVASARWALTQPGQPPASVVAQLPRADHQVGLMLAITAHLLCRRPPVSLQGPVIYVGMDVQVGAELRRLTVRNRRRMNLAEGNPLSAHRIRKDGQIAPVLGAQVGFVDSSLLYLNTRVGRPPLRCRPPLVILDGTSVRARDARSRCIEWAVALGATIVALCDLGDDDLVAALAHAGRDPVTLAADHIVNEELVAMFGQRPAGDSRLSSAPMLSVPHAGATVQVASDPEVNDAVARCFAALGDRPEGPLPLELERPVRMFRNTLRLAAPLADYRRACTSNVRPGEMPSLNLLDRWGPDRLPPEWRAWQTTHQGALKAAVRSLLRAVDGPGNPKLIELWRALHALDRNGATSILVRCHSRAAVEATHTALADPTNTPEQVDLWARIGAEVRVTTSAARMRVGAYDAQVLTGAPPPWDLSLLMGAEAAVTRVLAYELEAKMLDAQAARWARSTSARNQGVAARLGARPYGPVVAPVEPVAAGHDRSVAPLTFGPLSLADLLTRASEATDPPAVDSDSDALAPSLPGSQQCTPIELDDGRTWWHPVSDRAAPVIVASPAGPQPTAAADLRAGDKIIVPAGDGAESVHARLVAASRSNDDVKALDLLLSQFRAAARKVLDDAPTRVEAIARARQAGAEAPGELAKWAAGTTIAPREPGDVAAVFAAAAMTCPDLRLIYEVAGALRSLSHTLGQFVAAISAGATPKDLEALRSLVGDVADDVVEEFTVCTVLAVRPPTPVPSSRAGRLR